MFSSCNETLYHLNHDALSYRSKEVLNNQSLIKYTEWPWRIKAWLPGADFGVTAYSVAAGEKYCNPSISSKGIQVRFTLSLHTLHLVNDLLHNNCTNSLLWPCLPARAWQGVARLARALAYTAQ